MNGLERRRIARKRLRGLSRWAQVQFACRCARRALPFYPGRLEHLRIITKAIRIAETAASEASQAAGDEAVEKLNRYYTREGEAARAGEIPNSYYAATAAYAAYLAAMDTPARDAVCVCSQDAAEMALLACKVFHGDGDSTAAALAQGIIEDLTALEALTGENSWTDDSAVPKSLLPSLNAGHGEFGDAGPSVRMVLRDGPAGNSIIISVNGASEALGDEILTRVSLAVQAILRSYAADPARDATPAMAGPAAHAVANELLTEKAYRLLRALARNPCKLNKTTWCIGITDRGNAGKFIEELESRGFVLRDADNLYSISRAGLEHLAGLRERPPGGAQPDA